MRVEKNDISLPIQSSSLGLGKGKKTRVDQAHYKLSL